MEKINLLDFLRDLKSAKVSVFNADVLQLVDFLNLITEDEQFTQNIDLGLFFLSQTAVGSYIVIEGMDRLLSLSLLLHAVCECYKRTSTKNEKAIKVIRNKYLLNGEKTKIRLNKEDQVIYDKIIFGERLSGKEKKSPIFELLHIFWSQIKIEGYQATKIIKMLQKTSAFLVETQDVPIRELYYTLYKWDSRLNQLQLIEDYLNELQLSKEWNKLIKIFNKEDADIKLFFKNFFITKFNVKEYKDERLYEFFVNYFKTMLNYMDSSKVFFNILTSAKMFFDLLNVNFSNEKVKEAMIRIKMHRGEDTYAYLMNLLDDYKEKRISEKTFIDILNTIDEYLVNRKKEDENLSFNELVQYLNVLIACK